ncbi:amino acid adenylation domain-containing protein [Micromonospora sp. WMMD710]|uniref:amino acid adenylation domain-containing protein n=1 Tax=Micromonospora sp. WMMD710 TaxID=3016085 RepID=UPI002416CB0F|nr:amino acid adenylation domain-containing protein [Micromonospora sp. WMMD710]MDG4759974.1 amino acid adenylation domain-containing protein [Micromonospora sp. WMMD710]
MAAGRTHRGRCPNLNEFDNPNGTFVVLVNDEEQYSLWPSKLEYPTGWREARQTGSREECHAFIESTWSDIRPASARGAAPEHDPVALIHDMVADQARRTPHNVAVNHAGTALTYEELDTQAESLAARLRSAGVGGGSVVAVVLGRSLPLITTLLAILKAGGAYLYLDPTESPDLRRRILADSAARFAVVSGETADAVPEIGQILCVDDETADRFSPEPADETPITADTPMYVCYTSGSTGEPKGVVVPHRAVFRLINKPDWIDVQPQDVFLQLTRVGFDVSTFEIWTPLIRGNRLALASTGHADFGELIATVQNEGITVLWLTTGLFHKIVDHHLDGLGGVRHLLAGGDVLSPSHVRQLMEAHPHLIFTNGYGPTENTTYTTCWTSRTPPSGPRVSIGRAIEGTTTMILDDALRPVKPGEVGELWVGGPGVATGYLRRPVATAEKFVADIDPSSPGARMYRTGDLVVVDDSGDLDFLGRADRQLKIRGYRVEPSTVEMELMSHPKVQRAVVLAHTDGAGDARLIATVAVGELLADEASTLGNELRDYLHKKLPAHLVPWGIFPVTDIPLNPNGKVDRSALPAAKMPRNVWNEYVEPSNDLQRKLAEIWSDALEIEPIGITDDFFELGGHSLLAAELLAALESRFTVAMSARTLFLNPTIEALAEEVSQRLDLAAAEVGKA